MSLPWYKRYPRDFVFDNFGLGPDLIGAFSTALDLIYAAGEPIPNDAQWFGRLLGCSTKRARSLLDQLIARGKLILVGDQKLSNLRAETELAIRRKTNARQVLSGHQGGTKSAENRRRIEQVSRKKLGDFFRDKGLDKSEIKGLDQARLKHARVTESEIKTTAAEFDAARARQDEVTIVGRRPLLLPIESGQTSDDIVGEAFNDLIIAIDRALRQALDPGEYSIVVELIDPATWRKALQAEAQETGAGARHIIDWLGRRKTGEAL